MTKRREAYKGHRFIVEIEGLASAGFSSLTSVSEGGETKQAFINGIKWVEEREPDFSGPVLCSECGGYLVVYLGVSSQPVALRCPPCGRSVR